jgi:TPR repeat protein
MCKACANLMSNRRRTYAATATEALQSRHLTITDLQDFEEDYKRAIIESKCPMCRSKLPRTEEDSFRCVENNVRNHEDWAWAHRLLGCYYGQGFGCLPDPKQAFIHFEKAANMGDILEMETLKGSYGLANCYMEGTGVEKSQAKAIHWYKQGANAGFALSEYSLGRIYHSQEKFSDAFRYFELSANQAYDESQSFLADCYERGVGVQPSNQKSMFWNKEAANNGNMVGMANYAVNLMQITKMQNSGEGDLVGKSIIPEVLYWARKSKAAGFEEAETLIRLIETHVSRVCAHCKSILPLSEPLKCARCKAAYYCGKNCQLQHWKRGHQWDCMDANGIKKSRG